MFCPFFSLLMLCGGAGVLVWLGWKRLADHMRKNPAAAKLVAEHVIAPLLMGSQEVKEESKEEPKPEVKKIKATLV